MGVEIVHNMEDAEVVFHAEITYDDATWEVLSLTWENGTKYDYRLTIISPGKPDIVTTIQKNRSGRIRNVPSGYFLDGPLGAGYALEPLQ